MADLHATLLVTIIVKTNQMPVMMRDACEVEERGSVNCEAPLRGACSAAL